MDRTEFMAFLRDDTTLNQLSNDDRLEIFMSILAGASDITKSNLDYLLRDYCVANLEILELPTSC